MKKKSVYFKDHPYCLYESVPNSPFPLPTNSLGLIGKVEYSKKKSNNCKRILFLGASPIERLPPPNDNKDKNPNLTVTHLLEEKLNQKNKDLGIKDRYEVINLSSSAYTSYECLFSYICKGRYLNPDLIISYQGVNDVLWAVIAQGFLKDYSHARKNNFQKQECTLNNILCALPDSKIINFIDKIPVKFNLKKPNGLIYSISAENLKFDLNYSNKKLDTFFENIQILNNLTILNNSKLLNLTFVWDENKPANPSHVYRELKESKTKKIFNDHYNKYLNRVNYLLKNNRNLNTFVLKNRVFDASNFSDGVHFNLKGMNFFSSQIAEYIFENKNSLFN